MRGLAVCACALSGCSLIFDGKDLHGTGGSPDLSVPGDDGGGGGDMTGQQNDLSGDGGGGDMGGPLTTVEFTKAAGSPIQIGLGPSTIAAGDLDGDGKIDLITADQTDNNLTYLYGNGNGTFTVAFDRPSGLPACTMYAAAIGHFNSDSFGDVAFVCTDNAMINVGEVLLGSSTRSYTPMVITALAVSQTLAPHRLWAGDLNDDLKDDLLVVNEAGNSVWALFGNGTGGFPTVRMQNTGTTPVWATAGRLNADPLLDVVVVNEASATFNVLMQTVSTTFGTVGTIPGPSNPEAAVIADFNADGKGDVAVSSSSVGATTVSIYTGKGDGTFIAPTSGIPVAAYPYALASADFNRDGRPDLVTANNADDNCSLLINTGGGSFAAAVQLPCGVAAAGVVAVDLNKDGLPDLAVMDRSMPAGVTILLNTSH